MLSLPVIVAIFVVVVVVIVIAIKFGKRVFGQIIQLSFQNKLLIALRHLDIAALPVTEVNPICQEIVNVIRSELGYFFGAIALIDNQAGGLRRIAISQAPELDILISRLPIEYQRQIVLLTETENLLVKVINTKQSLYTTQLYDIQKGVLPIEISYHLQKTINLKGLFIHPLVTKDGVIGVIYYATLIEKEKLSKFEFEIMNGFTRDVSRILENVFLYQDLKQTSKKLAIVNQQLKELDKLKDDFVSIASHELRTPMTAIRSYAWMALHRSDVPLSKTLEKYIARILISTERLINLVNDMLNVSRIESGRIEINPEPVDLLSLAHDIIDELYYSRSPAKKAEFAVLEKPIPKVLADPDKLRQVLLNLVGNSLKFTPNGGKIIFDFFTDGKVVETSVIDSGVGMSRDDLSKLFSKFGRLDNSYTAAATSGGTGLGLYISKKLVELMHGKIRANSEGLNKGSTFTVLLPVATADNMKNIDTYRVKPKGEAKGLESVAI
ncbi:hypothetical protein A3J19_02800 [Candidatus Daviesbacteria bacterium RIFCSPLOWO2_02_FULL_41_8]|uniref:histidine kinase n=3 Tax=Candidatus Daviesiibacteriota TaxID=1752718 RepID=A0A1F5NIS8_9BACT|nr:MAG: hypothetical protein A2871_00655 [Candidatus Daviesbacteria bacterium RIFCSPHIGHO2_01_FULL_41_23]OGE33415.1 MAG: hypothetical protein A3D83_00265 [Candidatus Daviesbacteria bacterium RIFCSPHIGHO2_02_FULL_41_10]OGE62405.1 MAG: hypothetical protein A2967_01145 [Candidatus Daviesbacteria bacterium RIFCSPLOWO2_01_FULL_41_32]OGE77577.1 MAG: hypothetical protein A3J19_02800 [Candidatus Daviesbacteria bacterium RIFCSPLOWO2_02_FULL_41_8]